MTRALIVVDVQNDFCEGGSLAVEGGAEAAARITDYLNTGDTGDLYDCVVTTKDWHGDPGSHFSVEPDYSESWPEHCKAGTEGAEFHPNLKIYSEYVFFKGQNAAAYSGFEGHNEDEITLHEYLQSRGVTEVDVCGIAFDYCVKATAVDAVKNGYKTRVLTYLTASVAAESAQHAEAFMAQEGVEVV